MILTHTKRLAFTLGHGLAIKYIFSQIRFIYKAGFIFFRSFFSANNKRERKKQLSAICTNK